MGLMEHSYATTAAGSRCVQSAFIVYDLWKQRSVWALVLSGCDSTSRSAGNAVHYPSVSPPPPPSIADVLANFYPKFMRYWPE